MKEQAITAIMEIFAELHVEYLKTGKGDSVVAHLSKIESEHKGDWKGLAATEAAILLAVSKKIAEELDADD